MCLSIVVAPNKNAKPRKTIMYLIHPICLWVTFSLLCELTTLHQNLISGEVFIRKLVLPLILRLINFVFTPWVTMLSLPTCNHLNPVFSHICLHKTSTTVLLSLSTFPLSLPNSLQKGRGSSNTPLYPQSPLSLIWLQMYLVWITEGEKKWICRHNGSGILRQQETKAHQRW